LEKRKKSIKMISKIATSVKAISRSADIIAPKMFSGVLGKKEGKARPVVPQIALTKAVSTLARPIVTMITDMMGSPIIGRKIKRSTTTPNKTAAIRVSSTPMVQGSPIWMTKA
jgi:hypothetical protein